MTKHMAETERGMDGTSSHGPSTREAVRDSRRPASGYHEVSTSLAGNVRRIDMGMGRAKGIRALPPPITAAPRNVALETRTGVSDLPKAVATEREAAAINSLGSAQIDLRN